MSNVAISFASLVKDNNGMFKSEKQAAFLLSQCQDANVFTTGGNVYNNSFTMFYNCDSLGVVSVEKYTPKSGKTVTTWTRVTNEQFQANQEAKAASKARDIALQEASAAKWQARQDAFNNALVTAQNLVKAEMSAKGVAADMIERILANTFKDQDAITSSMDFLIKFPEFVKAWEAYNNEPGM